MLRDDVTRLIAQEGLAPGDRLPTESRLAEHFGVARSTVREALKRLEEEGLVDAIQGRGRFVSAMGSVSVERPITRFEGIFEMLTGLGRRITTMVLSVDEVTANVDQAEALSIDCDAPLIRVIRLHYEDDDPLVFNVDYIVRDALPGPIAHRDWSAPLTAALEAQGHRITSSVARINAVELPTAVARAHKLEGLGPWLLITETCLSQTGRRVMLAYDYHRGASIGFNVRRRR